MGFLSARYGVKLAGKESHPWFHIVVAFMSHKPNFPGKMQLPMQNKQNYCWGNQLPPGLVAHFMERNP